MRIAKTLLTFLLFFMMSAIHAQFWQSGTGGIFYNGANVGIGTTAPGYPLTINKDGFAWNSFNKTKNPNLMVNGNNQNGGGIAISDDGGFFDWNDGYITFEPLCCASGLRVSSANFIVDNNIGISTTNPQARLSLGAGAPGKKFLVYDNGAGSVQTGFGIDLTGSPRELSIFHSTSDGLDGDISFGKRLESSGAYTEAMRIMGSGNVAIGTTDTKGHRFAVNGSAVFTKVVVKPYNNWPDYVFHTTYRLRPLNEVEQYIKQNGHLPEVPSAEEMEKNGLDVGGNQAVLLKKIEELTLYVIEQNKKIEVLEAEMKLRKGEKK